MKSFTKLTLLIVLLITLNTLLFAQDADKEKKFGITWYGYVKNDFYYDTRQNVEAREGHLLLWPLAPSFDENGIDVNEHGSFNFLAIQTRLGGRISGPDFLGAKTSGLIEAEFFGHTDADVNGLRLRHAISKMRWEKGELMLGQFWHPLFVLECFPGTVSFNTGLGFQPFSRNPQIKYSYHLGNFRIAATAFGERDFSSRGLDNKPNSIYLRNSGMPAMNVNLHYGTKNDENKTAFNIGFAGNYKSILPSKTTTLNYQTKQTVDAISGVFYVNTKFSKINIKLSGGYLENACDIFSPGGFAIYEIINPLTAEQSYIPTRNAIGWLDISSCGTTWQFGVFAGYNQSLGTAKDIDPSLSLYGLGMNIHHLYRVSPRITYKTGNVSMGAEIEYTVAAYGDGTYDAKGTPQNPSEVANIRFITGVYYHF